MSPFYPVDAESLDAHFPPHFRAPPLLLAFAEWLRDKLWLSVGDFRLQGRRWDDWGENAGDLYRHFALFLRTSDGSEVAFWLPDGEFVASPPIVFLGSEGELGQVGNSLAQFLARLAARETMVPALDSRDAQDEGDFFSNVALHPACAVE
jgi:hypothetical protein